MLELEGLSKHFGGVRAVDQLSATVNTGEIVGLIGPNGSGKSTTINLIGGVLSPSSGSVRFKGQEISNLTPHRRVAMGIGRTFQNIRMFGDLKVWENLWVAQCGSLDHGGESFVKRWMGGNKRARASVEEMLEFSGLADKRDHLAGNLAFGEQRRLELARSLATNPDLLLLDEPAAGMNRAEIADLDERLVALKNRGKTILLVEHNMSLVMAICDRIVVMNFGQRIAEGTPEDVQKDPAVTDAYLGQPAEN